MRTNITLPRAYTLMYTVPAFSTTLSFLMQQSSQKTITERKLDKHATTNPIAIPVVLAASLAKLAPLIALAVEDISAVRSFW